MEKGHYCVIRLLLPHGDPSRVRGLTGSALDHRSLPPEFEPRCGHIWRLFHLWGHFITFGDRSVHLTYHVHKSGVKMASRCFYRPPLMSWCLLFVRSHLLYSLLERLHRQKTTDSNHNLIRCYEYQHIILLIVIVFYIEPWSIWVSELSLRWFTLKTELKHVVENTAIMHI